MSDEREKALKKEADKLWDVIRDSVKRLDEIGDQLDLMDGTLFDDDIPESQVLVNLGVVYSLSYIDDDGTIEQMNTYMTDPSTGGDTMIGMMRIVDRQIIDEIAANS